MMFKIKPFLTGFLLFLALIFLMLFTPSFTKNIDLQTMRLYEMNRCFTDGQIPCRWVPDLGGIYGYPLFQYYGPFPYYLGEIVYLLSGSLLFAVRAVFAIAFLGAYFFPYLLSRRFLSQGKSVLFGLIYCLTAYFIVTFYLTGSLGEIWALMLLPAYLWATLRLKKSIQVSNCLYVILFSALFILSHNISMVAFLPLAGLLLLIFFFQKTNWKFFKLFIFSSIFSLLVASFYWIPVLFEGNLVHAGKTPWGYLLSFDRSGFDFLPINAEKKPLRSAASPYKVLTGETDILNLQSGTNWLSLKTDTKTHSIIRLSLYYFPGWKLMVDGEETKIDYKNNSLGLVTVILGPGLHNVYMRLYDTPVRMVANFLSVIGGILYLAFALIQIHKIRRWLDYYLKGLYR